MHRLRTITLALITLITFAQFAVFDFSILNLRIELAISPDATLFTITSLLSFLMDSAIALIISLLPIVYFCTKDPVRKDNLYAVIRYVVIIRYIMVAPLFTALHIVNWSNEPTLSVYLSWLGIVSFLFFSIILFKIKPASERQRINLADFLAVSYASKSNRFLHFLIDGLLFLFIFPLWCGLFNTDYPGDANILRIIFLISYAIYYFISEAMFRATLGKYLTGTMVAGTNKRMFRKLAFYRSICRLIPFEAISFLIRKDWHDKLSGTAVVYANSLQTNIFESESIPSNKEIQPVSASDQ